MHSEHDLKERSDAQIIVSHFPCGAQPFYTTLGTKGWRPDGCHTPLCAAGAGPFGNTGKHRPSPGPDPDRAERRLNPHASQGLVHKKSALRACLPALTVILV